MEVISNHSREYSGLVRDCGLINEGGGRVCLLPNNKFFVAIAYHPEKRIFGFVLRPSPTDDAAKGPTGSFHYQNVYSRALVYLSDILTGHLQKNYCVTTIVDGTTLQRMTLCDFTSQDSTLTERTIEKIIKSLNNKGAQRLFLMFPRNFVHEFPQLPLLSDEEYAQVMATLQLPEYRGFVAKELLKNNGNTAFLVGY